MLHVRLEYLSLRFNPDAAVSPAYLHLNTFLQSHHAQSVYPPGQVVVKTVEGTCIGKPFHDSGYLPVRECAAQ